MEAIGIRAEAVAEGGADDSTPRAPELDLAAMAAEGGDDERRKAALTADRLALIMAAVCRYRPVFVLVLLVVFGPDFLGSERIRRRVSHER